MGTKSLKHIGISQQVLKIHNSSFKTEDNTPSILVNKRVLVRPKRGHYALAPAQFQHLRSLQPPGEKESKTIEKTSVGKVPDTIP